MFCLKPSIFILLVTCTSVSMCSGLSQDGRLEGPGPAYRLRTSIGTKEHCLTKSQAPAYTIGIKHQENPFTSPGPTYSYDPSLTRRGRAHAPAFPLAGRPQKIKGPDLTPGPGDYDTLNVPMGVVSDEHKTPYISIGQRTKLLIGAEAPPPNTYNIKCGIGSKAQTEKYAPAWSLRGRSDYGGSHYTATKAGVPGPATYGSTDPAIYKSRSAGYTIQGRTTSKDYSTLRDNPGPNAYNPWRNGGQLTDTKKGFTMGVRHSEYVMPLICNVDNM